MKKQKIKIDKLCIIAGSGMLPLHIYHACKENDIAVSVIGIKGDVDLKLFKGIKIEELAPYQVSKIIKSMHQQDVKNVMLAGKVSKVEISKLLLDLKGAKLFTHILKAGMNDDAILTTIMTFIESEGFKILATDVLAQDLIMPKGSITKTKPTKQALDDIKAGLKVLKEVSKHDVGQSLIIQSGLVLGVEAAEGTDALIERCGSIKQPDGDAPILIKIFKPHQDKRVDRPCIGVKTIESAHKFGIAGIAIESSKSFLLNKKEMIDTANKLKIFIYGI